DLSSGVYRPDRKPDLPELAAASKDLRALLSLPGKIGQYAWRVLGRTLAYAAALVPEASDDIPNIDEAMRLGYNWQWGPFELIDRIGAGWFAERLGREGIAVPALLEKARDKSFYRVQQGQRQFLGSDGGYHDVVRPQGVLLLEDVKRRSTAVLKNASAS